MMAVIPTVITLFTLSSGSVLNEIGRLYIPDSDVTGAENVAIVPKSNRLFTADGANLALNVIKFELSNDILFANVTYEDTIFFSFEDFLEFNKPNITLSDVTSVEYSENGEYLITCLVPDEYWINNGWLAFVDPDTFKIIHLMELIDCNLPDHVTIALNGNLIIVSCEGEPNDNESEYPQYNPSGSVTIVNVTKSNYNDWTQINVGFTDFNIGGIKEHYLSNMDDIYIPHKNWSISANIEPEYASCDYNDKYCYIALQENNGVAILDIDNGNNPEIVAIYSLGKKDYSLYGLDASDKDKKINIKTYTGLYGLRMADNIKYFESKNGRKYFMTANEGDSKDFDESRVKDLVLNETVFGNVSILQRDEELGRLKVINQLGQSDNNNGIYNKLYTFSSRDFTIFEVTESTSSVPTITQVFSSKSDFELITADTLGINGFNSNGIPSPSFDKRSDDKGPEPECLMVGKCSNGRLYAFIGLERVGGIMVYDMTHIDDNGNVTFVEYENNRNFSVIIDDETRPSMEAGDVGPEQIRFIDESIYGVPLLIVASAESASVTIYRIDCKPIISSETTEIPTTTQEYEDGANIHYILISIVIPTILSFY